jgi:hypothetical protein
MIHPTYRQLDEPPKLAGFSFMQWVSLLAIGAAVAGVLRLLGVSTQPAISAFTLLVGTPAALIYFSESGRPTLLRLARDLARWVFRAHVYEPGAGRPRPALVRAEPTARGSRGHRGTAAVRDAARAPERSEPQLDERERYPERERTEAGA